MAVKPLPQTPILAQAVDKTTRNAFTDVHSRVNQLIKSSVSSSDVVTTATPNKILKLDANGKLPASITGDAATVGGKAPGTGANNVLVLDTNGKVPTANLPIASASALGAIKVGANLSIDANGVLSAISTAFDAAHSFATNGYQKLSNGLIIQWGGPIIIAPLTTVTVTFPIAFLNSCLNVQITENASGTVKMASAGTYTKTTFDIYNPDDTTTDSRRYVYFAIGY